MSFANFKLSTTSLELLKASGIETPTPIQDQAIPQLLDGFDVVGQAHTGSGKTLAFGLPLVEICDPKVNTVQALILVPTRELALQVGGVIEPLARARGLTLVNLYGGVSLQPQTDALARGVHVVVGTPGRVLDHLMRRALNLGALELLVLDEADQMLDKGFAPDVERIIRVTPRDRQTALFSATTPEWVRNVSARHLHEPVWLTVQPEETEPDIEHVVVESWDGDKMNVLLRLLDQQTGGSTLVFGRTRHGVMNLARRLRTRGYEVEALQGDLGQATRERIVQRFRSGRIPILLATNVAARGLDMLNIDRVINYDLPETGELFVHRVGRTGRMGRYGQAITLIAATDLTKMQEIERHLGRKLRRISSNHLDQLPQPALQEPLADALEAEAATDAEAAPRKRRRRRRGSGNGADVGTVLLEGSPA